MKGYPEEANEFRSESTVRGGVTLLQGKGRNEDSGTLDTIFGQGWFAVRDSGGSVGPCRHGGRMKLPESRKKWKSSGWKKYGEVGIIGEKQTRRGKKDSRPAW